jgi:type II secretion system protein J
VKTTRSRGGFTLLELLVVIGLMGVVSTLGTTFFFSMTDAWNATRQRTDLDAQADNAFDAMRKDFQQIVSPRLAGVPLSAVDRLNQNEKRFWNQALGDDEMSFPVLAPVGDGDAVRCARVRYYVDRGAEQSALVREVNDFGQPDEKAIRVAAAPNVVWMDLEFLSGGQWAASWDKPGLPDAVRVNLTLLNPDSLEQVTRKAVFPVRVK